jgi:hypothetical protein
VRLTALEALVRLGGRAEAAVPALRDALADRDDEVLLFAAWALGRIGPPAAAAASALIGAHARREGLIEAALARIAPADPAVRALFAQAEARRRARDPLRVARFEVAHNDAGAVPRLLALLQTRHRDDALTLLGELGVAAHAAAPAVRAVLDSGDASGDFESGSDPDTPDRDRFERCPVVRLAARTLWRVTRDASLVRPYLERQFPRGVRGPAATGCDAWALPVLAEMGPAAAPAAPLLRRWATHHADTADAVNATLRAMEPPP